MDEREWLKCADLAKLFEAGPLWGKVSERKYRLFAVACCRRIWSLLRHEQLRRAVEMSEQYADGHATEAALEQAVEWFNERAETGVGYGSQAEEWASSAAFVCITQNAYRLASEAAYHCAGALGRDSPTGRRGSAKENKAQCDLLRDLFGYPFRPITIERSCRTPAVRSLAQAAYANRELPAGTLEADRLAVLADALEDAGCADAYLLGHLRGPGPHHRGCWPVDLILDKK